MPAKYSGLLDSPDMENMEKVSLHSHSRSHSWAPASTSTSSRPSKWSIDPIRPQFLRRTNTIKKPLRRTAWLDGLRGFAAFLVYWHHHHLLSHRRNEVYENAFGYNGQYYFIQLPGIRTFFAGGHFAVSIFFVISGYVLSVKPLSLIQKHDFASAADNIGSALFRRWLRLYLPVIAVTFLWILQKHTWGLWVPFGDVKETFREEVWNWYARFKNYSFVFLTGDLYEFPFWYHPHIWSIPLEMKGSIVVYTVLLALARCTKNARLWCEVGLVWYFMYVVDGWYAAAFMAGMLLCDIDLLVQNNEALLPRLFTWLSSFKELIFFHLFVLGLYLGGAPAFDDDRDAIYKSPGWIWLSYLKPQAVFEAKWFYLFWGAVFLIASIPRLPFLKSFFETRFCQYLARISYALYLVHGPVMSTLGVRLYAAVGWATDDLREHIPQWVDVLPLSKRGPVGLEVAFWAPHLVLLPVTLYLAEMGTKLLDETSVRFAQWCYGKATVQPESSPVRSLD